MIKNFETITVELSQEELNLLPIIVHSFLKHKKGNPIKAPEIIKGMQDYLERNEIKTKFSDARLRKFVNYIRVNAIIPLCSTSNGYFCSYDEETLNDQVLSLKQRAYSINKAAEGLEKFIDLKDYDPRFSK